MNRLTNAAYIPERVVPNLHIEFAIELYKKLCEYENTGIEPEQISAMMAHNTALIEQLRDYEEQENKLEQVYENNADVLIVKPNCFMHKNDMESMRIALVKQIEDGVIFLPKGFECEVLKNARKGGAEWLR